MKPTKEVGWLPMRGADGSSHATPVLQADEEDGAAAAAASEEKEAGSPSNAETALTKPAAQSNGDTSSFQIFKQTLIIHVTLLIVWTCNTLVSSLSSFVPSGNVSAALNPLTPAETPTFTHDLCRCRHQSSALS